MAGPRVAPVNARPSKKEWGGMRRPKEGAPTSLEKRFPGPWEIKILKEASKNWGKRGVTEFNVE